MNNLLQNRFVPSQGIFSKRNILTGIIVIVLVSMVTYFATKKPSCPSCGSCPPAPSCPSCPPRPSCLDYNVMGNPISKMFSPSNKYMLSFDGDKLTIVPRFVGTLVITYSWDAPNGEFFGVNLKGQLFYTKKGDSVQIALTPEVSSADTNPSYIGCITDEGVFQIRTYPNKIVYASPAPTLT